MVVANLTQQKNRTGTVCICPCLPTRRTTAAQVQPAIPSHQFIPRERIRPAASKVIIESWVWDSGRATSKSK